MYSRDMQKSTSGFTIVELLVVCIVMAIIATIGTMAFIGYQNQSRASQGASMANIIKAGAEKYFNENGEYPNADQLATSPPTTTDVAKSAKVLSTSEAALTTSNFTFCVLGTTNCSLSATDNTKKVFYFVRAKDETNGLPINLPSINSSASCSVTISSTSSPETNGPTAYATAFYSPEATQWLVQKSNHGGVTTTCQAS